MNKLYKKQTIWYAMLQKKSSTKSCLPILLAVILSISFIQLYFTPPSFYREAIAQISTEASPGYLQHTDSNYGIRIQYPEDWQKTESGVLSRFNINNTKAVAEFHPSDMSVTLLIIAEKSVENQTLEQFVESNIADLREEQPNIQIIEHNRVTTRAGTPAYKLVAKGPLDVEAGMESSGLNELFGQMIDFEPVNMTAMSFITIEGNNAYLITYSDSSGRGLNQLCAALGSLSPECTSSNIGDPYSYYLPIAEKMIDSFEVTTIQNQTNGTEPQPPPINSTQPTNENPCSIIDIRLATGEIAIEEYERLREILQC